MAAVYKIIFLALFTTQFTVTNAFKHSLKSNCNHIKYRQNKIDKNILQKWEFELDGKLEYPRGDKDKLSLISAKWSDYYACSSQLERAAAAAACLPSVAVAVYEGGIARLPCGLCVAPDVSTVQWLYQKQGSSFSLLTIDERMVVADNGNLTILRVREEDAGVYKCTIGQSAGGTVLLDVVERGEPYNVVKPPTSRGPYPASDQSLRLADLSLLLFTSWDPWSECSVCNHVGRRRRYGMCYVKAFNNTIEANNDNIISTASVGPDFRRTNKFKLFKEFPAGVPCRSRHLPMRIRNMPAVAQRRNEIMIGLCKVPCETSKVFEVRSSNGELLERANNTEGVYSLSQRLPPDPPLPVHENIFATRGQKLILICPGIPLRDIPFTWRVGTKKLVPRGVDKASGGRVHLNARDDIVFTEVTYSDANLYSCWQSHILYGTVRLSVRGSCPGLRARLLAAWLAAALVLRALDAVLRRHRRRNV